MSSETSRAVDMATRAASFGAAAAAYAEHRPDYPVEAISWGLAGATPGRVLELGAGTGILTATLVELGMEVIAVEPDPEMLGQLRSRLPRVTAHQASAEAIPLPNGEVDAIFVGQALHWFDLAQALPEMARVLRPGGRLVALWNADDDREPWVAGMMEILNQTGFSTFPTRGVEKYPPFMDVEITEIPHRHRRTIDSELATLATHSARLILPADERAELLGRVRDYLNERPETASGEFDLPLVTITLRAHLP
jgi:SAM-dependent methyltransferase